MHLSAVTDDTHWADTAEAGTEMEGRDQHYAQKVSAKRHQQEPCINNGVRDLPMMNQGLITDRDIKDGRWLVLSGRLPIGLPAYLMAWMPASLSACLGACLSDGQDECLLTCLPACLMSWVIVCLLAYFVCLFDRLHWMSTYFPACCFFDDLDEYLPPCPLLP